MKVKGTNKEGFTQHSSRKTNNHRKLRLLGALEIKEVIDDEKKLVRIVCLGLIHPPQENQKDFTSWLQDVVIFHLNQIKQKLFGDEK